MTKTRRALLVLLALALLKGPLDALLANLLPDAFVDPVPQWLAGAVVSVLLLGLPAWRLRPWTSPRLVLGMSLGKGIALGVLAAAMCRFSFSPVDAAWQRLLGVVQEMANGTEGLPVALWSVLALAGIPAVTEEAFFRGARLTGLLDGSRRITALLLTTLAFALMHGNAANLPSLLGVSLVLTLLMLHTGCIAVPITAHLVYNLLVFVPARLPLWGSGLAGLAVIALVVRMIYRQPKMACLPMKWLDRLIAGAVLAVLALQYFV